MPGRMKIKALIADDEPLARERLSFLLSGQEGVEVAGECRNGKEVIAALKKSRFDVLFLDIQMPGRSGFEVIEQIGPAQMPVTVFVTAHNEYAVQAFEVHALDYLTKPVEPERLQATLVRVRERIASQAALMTHEQMKSVLSSLENGGVPRQDFPRRLLVHNGAKDSFVNVNEIDWIEAADYYACLHVGSKSFMLRETIKELSNTLDSAKFVRIHRSIIVNVEQVSEIFREGQSEGSVVLKNGQRLRMSKAGWQSLLAVSQR
jgi:two-component system LytT family response regulator